LINSDLKDGLEVLKSKGIRLTPQRYAILAFLYKTELHVTADEIYKALEKNYPNMSIATVYNNLRVFLEIGLIEELLFGDNSSKFEVKRSQHYHVICNICGKIEDFSSSCLSDMESIVIKEKGFLVEGHRVEFFGICKECQKDN